MSQKEENVMASIPQKKIRVVLIGFFCLFFLQEIGQAEDFSRGFSLKLLGGYRTMTVGDFNTIFTDTGIYYDTLLSPHGFTKNKGLEVIKGGLDVQVEFILHLTRNFGLSFGIGYIQADMESDMIWDNPLIGRLDVSTKSGLDAIPITLGGYYSLPLSRFINMYLNAGAGLYLFQSEFEYEEVSKIQGSEGTLRSDYDANGNGFGFHGGLGLEVNLGSDVVLFIEGKGLSVRFGGLEGRMSLYGAIFTIHGDSGDIWYFEYYDENVSQYLSGILYEDKPDGENLRNVLRLKIDLSGMSIQIGFRIGLGKWER